MKRLILGLLAFLLAVGLIVLLLVPAAGNQYRLWRDAQAAGDYRRAAEALDTLECGTRLAEARKANERLRKIALSDAFDEAYDWGEDAEAEPLDVVGSGVIAVLEIPKLGITMPVYRGFSRAALARGAVHLEGSSLPVGGQGTHCVLAGRAGGRFDGLLEGLDRLIPGDCFYIQALQDTLTYEVRDVETVETGALQALPIDGDEDTCTLMTTVPGEVSRLRLLVHARHVARRETPLEDDTRLLPGWAARLIFAAPVALAGLVLLALIEGLRRAVRRRRLKRLQL